MSISAEKVRNVDPFKVTKSQKGADVTEEHNENVFLVRGNSDSSEEHRGRMHHRIIKHIAAGQRSMSLHTD